MSETSKEILENGYPKFAVKRKKEKELTRTEIGSIYIGKKMKLTFKEAQINPSQE